MDNINYSSVTKWKVEVLEKSYDADSNIVFSVVETDNFSEPYIRLDQNNYNSANRYIRTTGYEGTKAVVVDSFIPFPNSMAPGPYYMPYTSRYCVYPTYALSVVIDGHYDYPSNNLISGSMMELGGASTSRDTIINLNHFQIPYYQYMSQTEFSTMLLTHNTPQNNVSNVLSLIHHGIGDGSDFNNASNGGDGIRSLTMANPTGVAFQSYTGANIGESTVYAVQKALGFYQQSAIYMRSEHLPEDAGDLAGALSDYEGFRSQANILLPIDSLGLPEIPPCTGEEGGDTDSGEISDACDDLLYDFYNGVYTDVYDALHEIMSNLCMVQTSASIEPHGINEGDSTVWPVGVINYIQFYGVAHPKDSTGKIPSGGLVRQLFRDSIFQADGSINLPTFNLKKGLYNMVLIFDDNSTMPLLFELDNDVQNHYNLSNLLTTNIYPVPFSTKFTLSMTAAATLSYEYTIYDERNHIYGRHDFTLRKGENKIVNISAQNLPKGVIFHKFVFEDGSETIISTIKN